MFGKQTATCRILVLFCCHTRSTIQRRYRQLSLNHHRLPQLLPLFVTLNRSRLRWRKVLYVQRYRHSPTSLLHELVTALDRSRLRWRKVLYVQRYRHSPTSLLHELMTALDRSRPQVKKSSSAAWDPYRKYQVNCLEMVQRRAARFVTRTQGTDEGCVTRALNHLQWPTLESRRKVARLSLLHKTLHGKASAAMPSYVTHKTDLRISPHEIPHNSE